MKSRVMSCLVSVGLVSALLLGAGAYGVYRGSIARSRAQQPWVSLEGPGFSTQIPPWPERAPSQSTFHMGSHNVGTSDGGLVLRWSPSNRPQTLDGLRAIAATMDGALVNPTELEPGQGSPGHARTQIEVDRPDGVWTFVTSWHCPEHDRVYLLLSTRASGQSNVSRMNAMALQHRALGQFRCHQPCEVPEAPRLPRLAAVPAGWTEVAATVDQRTYGRGEGEFMLFGLAGTANLDPQLAPQIVQHSTRALFGLEFEPEQELERDRGHGETARLWVGTGQSAEGLRYQVVFGLWDCGGGLYVGAYLGEPEAEHDAATWLTSATCTHDGPPE